MPSYRTNRPICVKDLCFLSCYEVFYKGKFFNYKCITRDHSCTQQYWRYNVYSLDKSGFLWCVNSKKFCFIIIFFSNHNKIKMLTTDVLNLPMGELVWPGYLSVDLTVKEVIRVISLTYPWSCLAVNWLVLCQSVT